MLPDAGNGLNPLAMVTSAGSKRQALKQLPF